MSTAAKRIIQSSITSSVTPPTPTLRGNVRSSSASTTYTLTPSSTPLGAVVLHIGVTAGVTITGPIVATGGGTVTWTLRCIGNDGNNSGSTRQTYAISGVGTFDGTDITLTSPVTLASCTAHLIDWANANATKPFTKFCTSPLPTSNTTSHTMYHQALISANNALGGLMFAGTNDQDITIDEGTVLRSDHSAILLSVMSFWNSTSFSNDNVLGSWTTSCSNGGFFYEVCASDSDTGPNAQCDNVHLAWTDAGGNITVTANYPRANQVVVFAAVTEKTATSTDFTSVVDGSANNYSKINAVNIDADHRLHVWAFRYGASPPSNTTITASYSGTLLGSVGTVVGLRKDVDLSALAGSTNTDWVVQSQTNTATGGTSISATLSGIASGSSVLAFVGKGKGSAPTADFVGEVGYYPMIDPRELQPGGKTFEDEVLMCFWNGGDEDNTPSATCSTDNLGIIAIEVA